MITGDNRLVAANVARQVGLSADRILTGGEIQQMSDEALRQQANASDVFAEVEPNQKERIILALKQAGHVVGYLGDGINDACALHAADVGISVDQAVDVAKEAADIVLLKRDLGVLVRGVQEGRATFANTLKYVYMATSANFGNMFSMAGASLFLPFLPLLPKQILLMNLLTDFPEMTIATDSVDEELLAQPRRWDIRSIRNFMLVFGTLSSVFDYLTFGALLLVLRADKEAFRTGWFLESVISASLIVLVVRSRQTVLAEQAQCVPAVDDRGSRRRNADLALYPGGPTIGTPTGSAGFSADVGSHCRLLRCRCGVGQAIVLPPNGECRASFLNRHSAFAPLSSIFLSSGHGRQDCRRPWPALNSISLLFGDRHQHRVDDVDHTVRASDVGFGDLGVIHHDAVSLSLDRKRFTVDGLGGLQLGNIGGHHRAGNNVVLEYRDQLFFVLRRKQRFDGTAWQLGKGFVRGAKTVNGPLPFNVSTSSASLSSAASVLNEPAFVAVSTTSIGLV